MALTRNFKETVIQRVQNDATFAQALLDEAATLFLNGEPETVRLILRDLVNATIGFEQLATVTAKTKQEFAQNAVTHRQPQHGQPGRYFSCST